VEDDVQNVRDEARERQLRRDSSVATWASEVCSFYVFIHSSSLSKHLFCFNSQFAAAAAEFAHIYAYSGQCAERAEQRAATKASVLQAVAAEREMQVGWHRAASQASADAYRERKAIATETWDRELAERQATRQQVLNAAARASDAARADAVLSAHILAERERQRRMTIDAAFVAGDKKARASWAPYVRVVMERERARRLAQTSGVCGTFLCCCCCFYRRLKSNYSYVCFFLLRAVLLGCQCHRSAVHHCFHSAGRLDSPAVRGSARTGAFVIDVVGPVGSSWLGAARDHQLEHTSFGLPGQLCPFVCQLDGAVALTVIHSALHCARHAIRQGHAG
jgi:hypothetical protein